MLFTRGLNWTLAPYGKVVLLLSAAVFAGSGCGGSSPAQIAKATKSVQATVQQAQETAAQAAGIDQGSVSLSLEGPVELKKCVAHFTPKSASRPAVLQLMSYEDPAKEEFPSVFLWATAEVINATELAGRTIQGHLFVQREPTRGLWSTSTTAPIAIKVVKADLLAVTCEITEAEVFPAAGERSTTVSGKLVGVWKAGSSAPERAN